MRKREFLEEMSQKRRGRGLTKKGIGRKEKGGGGGGGGERKEKREGRREGRRREDIKNLMSIGPSNKRGKGEEKGGGEKI